MSRRIAVVWRQIKEKTFLGSSDIRLAKAKEFCEGLKNSKMAEDIQAFEVGDADSTDAYFDIEDNFKRHEMDG